MRQSEDHLVRIAVNREMLEGDLNVPSGAPGVVVFAHGSGSSRHSPRNRHIAQMLRQSGLATLLFDLLTPQEEQIDMRTGHLRFDIGLLAQRLIKATEWTVLNSELSGLQVAILAPAPALPQHSSRLRSVPHWSMRLFPEVEGRTWLGPP